MIYTAYLYANENTWRVVTAAGESAVINQAPDKGQHIRLNGPNGPVTRKIITRTFGRSDIGGVIE